MIGPASRAILIGVGFFIACIWFAKFLQFEFGIEKLANENIDDIYYLRGTSVFV